MPRSLRSYRLCAYRMKCADHAVYRDNQPPEWSRCQQASGDDQGNRLFGLIQRLHARIIRFFHVAIVSVPVCPHKAKIMEGRPPCRPHHHRVLPNWRNLWCGSAMFAERERVRPVWLQGFDGWGWISIRLTRRNAADEPVSRAIRTARSATHPVSCPSLFAARLQSKARQSAMRWRRDAAQVSLS